MEIYQTQAQLFKVLTHPIRLAILEELRDGEQCVCHMEAMFGLRQAYISQHLMVLRDAGLVADRHDGWNVFYRVSKPEIYKVIDAVNAFSDTISSGEVGNTRSNARSSGKKRPCPCPKCNSDAEPTRHDTPELGLNNGEATA
jgi:DNA-binding transcriptional ArsR family regulator